MALYSWLDKAKKKKLKRSLSTVFLSLVISPLAQSQSNAFLQSGNSDSAGAPEIQVEHGMSALDAAVAESAEGNALNTAIVLTSYDTQLQQVRCAGFNAKGQLVGKVMTSLAANGVGVLFASDMPGEAEFRGKVTCASSGEVIASAFLLGSQLTVGSSMNELKVLNEIERSGSFIRIPLAISN